MLGTSFACWAAETSLGAVWKRRIEARAFDVKI
jgi:hypothetical protein